MFTIDLAIGQANQEIVFRDLAYRGLQIIPTFGKSEFDGFLPNGQSIEVKLDLRSQATHYAALESATIARRPDFIAHTLCYYLILPFEVYNRLYRAGKIHIFGEQDKEGRLVTTSEMRSWGKYGDQWIKSLT